VTELGEKQYLIACLSIQFLNQPMEALILSTVRFLFVSISLLKKDVITGNLYLSNLVKNFFRSLNIINTAASALNNPLQAFRNISFI
jgi:hypothetical protein